METSQLKAYGPRARTSFTEAVTAQAARYGIRPSGTDEAHVEGDVLLVGGHAYPKSVAEPRQRLVERIEADGFSPTMEAVAYTWFNRIAAIRYMELHGYLTHGYRVLSHPEGQSRPEILDHATDVDFPGLDRDLIIELKLDGRKDEELYRLLLKAQCNALHQAMPFLFEKIGDETELLLPANLLHTDSLIRQLVEQIDEDLWQEIEIIGWLYQFYISEKKDEVIGKVVKSEDIPAATQLFTPNWIVKYMVQNSLGAQWLATYPESPLKAQMEYYIEPAEQTDEVNAQLAAITPDALDPEELTLIDPASGSGHILVEAYELFKTIYLERGYRQRDVAQLILEKNLYGLDIDERAAQLTGFALMMKARADDRRLFERGVELNVMALQDSAGFEPETVAGGVKLSAYGLTLKDLTELKDLFEHATTFGSLIQVPDGLAAKLPNLRELSEAEGRDLFVADALERLGVLVRQAELLAAKYENVVANPPYMGSKGMNGMLKTFTNERYADGKNDLFACFMVRGFQFAKHGGDNGMVTMQSWMFLSSYTGLRQRILTDKTIRSLAHLGSRAFGTISGEVVQTAAFVIRNRPVPTYRPAFFRLVDLEESEKRVRLEHQHGRFDHTRLNEFGRIPGQPIAYWIGESVARTFSRFPPLGQSAETLQGMTTCDNDFYLRQWWEVEIDRIATGKATRLEAKSSGLPWFPYTKGGPFRKWAGNDDFVVNWLDDGAVIRSRRHPTKDKVWAHNFNLNHIFKAGATYSSLSSTDLAVRYTPEGYLFDQSGSMVFADAERLPGVMALLNSSVARLWLEALCPHMHFNPGALLKIPASDSLLKREDVAAVVDEAVELARSDWDEHENSRAFRRFVLVNGRAKLPLSSVRAERAEVCTAKVARARRVEERLNEFVIEAYGLEDDLSPEVPIEQITLTVNPAYRYGSKLTEEERETRFREDTMEELVSYAIGCMMGRYSLDEPGLIYAHSGNEGFDPSRYATFPADDDGIVPLTDTDWFTDDATNRLIEFISVAWEEAHLEENLGFLAQNLKPRRNESSRETIRRYLCDKFFKDHHLRAYKKRPIYWLFSSGKQKAFQCLVYLHRYNEGTLARMRSEYVIPLEGKIAARIEQLTADIQAATSTVHRNRLQREQEKLVKQQTELLSFDEKLRHYADKRIALDLDDGVKVNYGKFGDLLAEVKAVHGKKAVA